MNPQYRIVEALGRGPLGTVYVAEVTGRAGTERVALKLLDPRRATSAAVARLEEAAPRLGWIKDARVVRVRGVVRFDGAVGVVSDLVEGSDLRLLLRLGQAPPGPAIDIATALAGALHAALFQTGPDGEPVLATHGDVRPSNVIITRWGDVRLLDTGVFRAVTGSDPEEARRLDPELRMAPEVAEGVSSPAADVFGVGLLLFELLAGRPFPRSGSDATSHRAAVAQAMNALNAAGVDPLAVTLAEALLAWEPEARPLARDVEKLARELRRNVGGATLREWAQQTVPLALDEKVPQRDPLVGTTLTAIPAPERPAAPRGYVPVPLPAPPRDARVGEIGPEDEETVTVTTPGRQGLALTASFDEAAILPATDEPTDTGEPDVTETVVAKVDTAPPRIALPEGPSEPVIPSVVAAPPRRGLSVVSGGRDVDPPTNPRPVAHRDPPTNPRPIERQDPPTNPRPVEVRGSAPRPDPRMVVSSRAPSLSVVGATPTARTPATLAVAASVPAPVPNPPSEPARGTAAVVLPSAPVAPTAPPSGPVSPTPAPTAVIGTSRPAPPLTAPPITPPPAPPPVPAPAAAPPLTAPPLTVSPAPAPPVRAAAPPPAPAPAPSVPVPPVTPVDLAPPVAPAPPVEEDEGPREEYREPARDTLIMAMPAGCFLLALLALGGFYVWLNYR